MASSTISFDELTCADLSKATEKEWLEVNGRGGYASSTLSGINSRRYHGLLVIPEGNSLERWVLVSKFEEEVHIGSDVFCLSTNVYPNTIHPTGFKYLHSFKIDPCPTWVYKLNDIEIEKQICMLYNSNTVVVRYALISGSSEIILKLRPLVAYRSHHTLRKCENTFNDRYTHKDNYLEYRPYESATHLLFYSDAFMVENAPLWYYNFQYERERQRGFAFEEDLFSPFCMSFLVHRKNPVYCTVTTEENIQNSSRELWNDEIKRRQPPPRTTFINTDMENDISSTAYRWLVRVSDSFVIARKRFPDTIIAGYPWYGELGRETMISLTGLLLCTEKYDIARSILQKYVNARRGALLPSTFDERTNNAQYSTIDTTLWFFYAVYKYLKYTKDMYFVYESLFDGMHDIIKSLVKNENVNYAIDSNYILHRKKNKKYKREYLSVSYDTGKSVEDNALWFCSLKVMSFIAKECKEKKTYQRYEDMSGRFKGAFVREFWNPEKQCLYHHVNGAFYDESIRPEQLLAVCLPFQLLDDSEARAVFESVERELLTMYGIRSLSHTNPKYMGTYRGDWYTRDFIQFQGTVWPFFLGFYLDAMFKINKNNLQIKEAAHVLLRPLAYHILRDSGLGFISEFFDGDFPHLPRGSYAYAPSIAEFIRVGYEYFNAFMGANTAIKC